MKKTLSLSLSAALLVIGLATQAGNYGNCGNYGYGCTNNVGGTNYCGDGSHQEFEQVIVLAPTANAPTNAAGVVKLRSDTDDATNSATLSVSVTGLNVGTYNVSVTDFTGTNTFELGTLDVSSNAFDLDDWEGDGFGCGYGTNPPVISTNTIDFGRGRFDLPAGLDATNVAFLFVYDTNGVVNLTGDFTTLTNITALVYNVTVAVTPGTASQVKGQGTLTLAYKKGKTFSSFSLNAAGLPPKQNLYLKANGVSSTTTSTSTKGTVKVKALPHANLAGLQTLEAKDKIGNVVFSLKF